MTDLATYSRSGAVGTIVMDDGKANVMSLAMLNALHALFDRAEADKTVVILKARGKHFSLMAERNRVYIVVGHGAAPARRPCSWIAHRHTAPPAGSHVVTHLVREGDPADGSAIHFLAIAFGHHQRQRDEARVK